MNHWLFKGEEIKKLENLPNDAAGIIYCIEDITNNKKYIGRKTLFNTRKVRISQKERKETKTRKKYKIVKKESDWLSYNGSCVPLLEAIKNGAKIKKEIIHICYNKKELSYYEVKYMFLFNVLEDDLYYNNNILGRFFKNNLFIS